MRIDEFDAFKAELKQLCASLGKAYTDPLAQAYWRVLRDIPLTEVEANVERILMTATKDTRFPKPTELRSTPTAQQAELPEGALRLNQETWAEKQRRNPDLARAEFLWSQYQLVLASDHEGSPQYAMALRGAREIEARFGDPRFFKYT
jgi:hypothetical protein